MTQRNYYSGCKVFVGSIVDHRGRNKKDKCSGIRDNWGIAWVTGRFEWFGTLAEAQEEMRKYPAERGV